MSFLPGVLSRNWQLKVSALAMAVLLWTVPRFDAQSSQVLEDIPIRVQLSDPNWALVGDPSPGVITVTLSGPARELIALGIERPPVQIPMDEVFSADTTVPLRPSWFRGSGRDGVVVEDLRPGAVSLTFEPIEEQFVPFSASLSGELPPGISLAGPAVITPAAARVFGPASRFEGVDSLRLFPVDLNRVDGSGPLPVGVDTTGLVGLDVLTLQVSLEVPTEATTAREFPGMVLVLPTLASDPQLQARPAAVTLVLMGAQSLVDGVDPEDLSVSVPTGRANLAPGGEERLGVVVVGVPEFVEYRVIPDWVLLRRPVGR